MKRTIKSTTKTSFIVFIAGIAIGVIGLFLVGYLSAIAIPEPIFAQFDSSAVLFTIIGVISQFLAFGLFAIMFMVILGRTSDQWLLNSLVCYLGFLFYVGILEPLIQGYAVYNPLAGISYSYNFLSFAVLPICLLLSSYFMARLRVIPKEPR